MMFLQTSIASPLESMVSIDCMFDLNTASISQVVRPFYARVIGWISIPLLCVLVPAVILVAEPAWHRFRCWRKGVKPSDAEMRASHAHARDDYYVSIVVSLYLVHPQITQKMFKLFSCRDLGGGRSFLQQDMQVDCNTLAFRLWQWGIGAPAILLYGFGIPVAAFVVMYRNRHRLDDAGFKRKFSFLYRGYKQRCWYWESMVIVRKLLVAVVVSVLDGRPQVQGLVGLGILLATLVARLKLAPWDSQLLDAVDFCGILAATITIYGGLFFYTPDFLGQVDESVITYCLIVVNALFVAVFVVVYFLEWAVKTLASLSKKHPSIARLRDRLTARHNAMKRRFKLVEQLDEALSGKNDGQNLTMKIRRLLSRSTASLNSAAIGVEDRAGALVTLGPDAESGAKLGKERLRSSSTVNLDFRGTSISAVSLTVARSTRWAYFHAVGGKLTGGSASGRVLVEGGASGSGSRFEGEGEALEGEEQRDGRSSMQRPSTDPDLDPPLYTGASQTQAPPEFVEAAYRLAPLELSPLPALGDRFPPAAAFPAPYGGPRPSDGGDTDSSSLLPRPRPVPQVHMYSLMPGLPELESVWLRTELLQSDGGDGDPTANDANVNASAGPWSVPAQDPEAVSPRPSSTSPSDLPDARRPLPGTVDVDVDIESGAGRGEPYT
eukprot:tig00020603_g11746.t1